MVEAAEIEVLPKNVREYIYGLERNILILKERLDLLLYKRFVSVVLMRYCTQGFNTFLTAINLPRVSGFLGIKPLRHE
jgi:hypothetical protein